MSLVSDRRAHLDLQVNLLAEQELTAILTVVCRMASHVGMDPYATHPELHALLQPTDVRELSDEINRELDSAPDNGVSVHVVRDADVVAQWIGITSHDVDDSLLESGVAKGRD